MKSTRPCCGKLKRMVAIIDGDHMQYIIGNNFKEVTEVTEDAKDAIKDLAFSLIEMTCVITGADKFILALSDPKRNYFRQEIYRYKPYKGNRSDEDWFKIWRPVILEQLTILGGQALEGIEADDILSYLAEILTKIGEDYVICSPDKDLRQIPGKHFDYSKKPAEGEFQVINPIVVVTKEEAEYFFYQQLLQGDSSDNIAGIPKMGPVNAKKLLNSIEDRIYYHREVLAKYCDSFGPFYGPIIFDETRNTVMLLNSFHPKVGNHQEKLSSIQVMPWTGRKHSSAALDELGWGQ